MTAPSLAPAVLDRLEALGRLWGVVRWFHPRLAAGTNTWDDATAQAVEALLADDGARDFASIVRELLGVLDDPSTRLLENGAEPTSESSVPADSDTLVAWRDTEVGRVAVVTLASLTSTRPTLDGVTALIEEVAGADALVVDLRAVVWSALEEGRRVLRRLIAEDIALPAQRTREHVGWSSEGGGYDGYYSATVTRDPTTLQAVGEGAIVETPLVMLCASGSPLTDEAVGLRAAGRARMVWCGPVHDAETSEVVELPDGARVAVRTSERVMFDGKAGVQPDAVVDPADTERALTRAVELLEARPEPPVALPSLVAVPPTAAVPPALAVGRGGTAEDDEPYPPVGRRVIALYKYWNVIARHFPYLELTDQPWDGVLRALLPDVVHAPDALAYHLAMARCRTFTNDTHSGMRSATFSAWRGEHFPPVGVRTVEGRVIVTAAEDERLSIGDVVVAVDGQPVDHRRELLTPYLPSSTPQALELALDRLLLGGSENTEAVLTIETAAGDTTTVAVPRSRRTSARPEPEGPVWRVLDEGPGYLDLSRLQPEDVDEAWSAVSGAPSLVFDIRGYPRGTAWLLAPRLTDTPVIAANFRKPIARPIGEGLTFEEFRQRIPPPIAPAYTGRIAVVIDARAVSQSEHTCLFFEAAAPGRVTFVGSPTTGANGDVTGIALPGGITIMMTGHDVRHADGRQLQRVGILPDVPVVPTIEGIRSGRDELLEAAIAALSPGKAF